MALALSVGMARSWVGLYTRGLPPEVREARRSEIDSDLWEQQWLAARRGDPEFGTAIEVLARMLLGTISDITWRAQAGASTRADRRIKVNDSWYMRAPVALGLILALLPIVAGVGAVADALFDPDADGGGAAFGAISVLAGAAVVAGLLTSGRNPVLGIGLVAAGAVTVAVAWYWMLPIIVPVGVVLVAVAVFRARATGWPRGPTPRPSG